MKRVAYELYVVHIDLLLDSADANVSERLLEQYMTCFPRHNYSKLGLDAVLSLSNIDWKAVNPTGFETCGSDENQRDKLQQLIGSVPSATSRSDVVSNLLLQLLVDVAKKNSCESILFGDSTTRLAERMLTETAKGRGFSLPWQVSDGVSPFGVVFNYPLRDVLKKELVAFTSLNSNPLADLVIYQRPSTQKSASAKTATINDLMAQYFDSVEEDYPSIVANVVRTSSKLETPSKDTITCSFCALPMADGTNGISGWGGDQNSTSFPAIHVDDSNLCYGCSRTLQPA